MSLLCGYIIVGVYIHIMLVPNNAVHRRKVYRIVDGVRTRGLARGEESGSG